MVHKAGFVNILGYPNVGKSTLMNALVGEKLSIITSKAQTTRHRIMGIVNGDDFQIVYSDTPGIIRKPAYKMHEIMNRFIETALLDADIVLLLTEMGLQFEEEGILSKLKQLDLPLIIAINKIDLSEQLQVSEEIKKWQYRFPKASVVPLSAFNGFNVSLIFDLILKTLPENPPYFPKDELTDKSERFFASEIIREKIFLNYNKEIPYSSEVVIDTFNESKNLLKIHAYIFVERDSQKGIILGHKGQAIKKTGIMARIDMEKFFAKKIFLELTVKVNKDWRNNENSLNRFGYLNA